MKKFMIHILPLLLSAIAAVSCSVKMDSEVAMPDMAPSEAEGTGFFLSVSGTASDLETNLPLRDMEIIVVASEHTDPYTTLSKKSGITDETGKFSIRVGEFTYPTSFSVQIIDPSGIYYNQNASHKIPLVSWDSNSNMEGNIFYINDIDFFMTKLQ